MNRCGKFSQNVPVFRSFPVLSHPAAFISGAWKIHVGRALVSRLAHAFRAQLPKHTSECSYIMSSARGKRTTLKPFSRLVKPNAERTQNRPTCGTIAKRLTEHFSANSKRQQCSPNTTNARYSPSTKNVWNVLTPVKYVKSRLKCRQCVFLTKSKVPSVQHLVAFREQFTKTFPTNVKIHFCSQIERNFTSLALCSRAVKNSDEEFIVLCCNKSAATPRRPSIGLIGRAYVCNLFDNMGTRKIDVSQHVKNVAKQKSFCVFLMRQHQPIGCSPPPNLDLSRYRNSFDRIQ